MRIDVDEDVENGYKEPVSNLRMNPEDEDDYDRGLVYDKVPEIVTRGHQKRVAKIEKRAAYAKYLIMPTA